MPLTDIKIRQAKATDKVQKLADGGSLFLVIKPNGTKLWWYRYKLPDAAGEAKERTFSIGEYPDVTLQDARLQRDAARALVKQGIHPTQQRQLERLERAHANGNTFKAVAEEWLEKMKARWSEGHYKKVSRSLAADVYPYIGSLPIRDVKAAHILGILQVLEKRDALSVAIMVRQWCSAIFRYATATLRADGDPAAPLVGSTVRKRINHSTPLSEDGIRAHWEKLGTFKGARITAIACELMLYLFPRTTEMRHMEWPDLDFEASEWWVDGQKMKMRRKHIVPLPRQAKALLLELQTITGSGRWCFPNSRKPAKPMDRMTINRALQYMGHAGNSVTAHDFRATASTILHERGYRSDIVELQLAHVERDKTKAAYNHALYMNERTRMMQEWADYVDSLRGEK